MTQLIRTADGSPTFYVPELDEHYHSTNGAIQEAQHVYVGAGLCEALRDSPPALRLLEVGFGTGLNALLTWEYVRTMAPGTKLWYETIEKCPLEAAQTDAFLAAMPTEAGSSEAFRTLHAASWDVATALDSQVMLLKRLGAFEVLSFDQAGYDVIYFDAFAPQKQPELWTAEVLHYAAGLLAPDGVIVTYCAQGALKRAWRAAGLVVESLAGAPGKREMVRARRATA